MFEFLMDIYCIFCVILSYVCGSSFGLLEKRCQNFVDTFIINATLGSKVFLPCNFKGTSAGNSSGHGWVLWVQRNGSSLVNISSEGLIDFLDPRDGRVKMFPNQFNNGSYSIRIDELQESDLGFYSCESWRDGCLNVVVTEEKYVWSIGLKSLVYIIIGVIGLILILSTCSYCCVKLARLWNEIEHDYENSDFKEETSASGPPLETVANHVEAGAPEERGTNGDRPIYENNEHDPTRHQHDQNGGQHNIITHLHGHARSQPDQSDPTTNQHVRRINQHISERNESQKRRQGFHRELLSRFRQASFGRYYVNQAEISQQATSQTENPQRASFWRKKPNPKCEYVNPIYN